ncbi:GSCOCG00002108001-RA-CDS [Cotesia congregata]|nr:GSCOCG00002108001-RA-CDS [Cotesia congregata]
MRNKSPSSKRVAVTPKSTPRVLQRTTSAPVTPRVVSARKNISTKFTPSKMSSALSAVASKSVSKVTSKVFKVPANPPMIMVTPNTPTSSSKNFSTFKSPRLEYGGKYFCTPGKAPPKEKRVFFPTPGKKNIPNKIYPGSSEVRSPVADYIRGGRDAITIKTIPKLQNEYLLSKEEVLNYKQKKLTMKIIHRISSLIFRVLFTSRKNKSKSLMRVQ